MTPDFVMLGVTIPDGVVLYASTELSHAELTAETTSRDHFMPRLGLIPGVMVYQINATMNEFVYVRAATYAEAFQTLMDNWRPQERRAANRIAPVRRAIES